MKKRIKVNIDKAKHLGRALLRLDLASAKRLWRFNTLTAPKHITRNFSIMYRLFDNLDLGVDLSRPAILTNSPTELPVQYSWMDQQFTLQQWQEKRSVCAMVVLKSGALAYETYLHNTRANDLRISWSVSKSFVSATFGILNDQGALPHLATRIGDILPELRNSVYAQATLRNLLNMSSGVDFNEDYLDYFSDINRFGRYLMSGGSQDEYAANMQQSLRTPGQNFQYASLDTHVLGMALREITGTPVEVLMRNLLLNPMGMESPCRYLTDSQGQPVILGGLNMTTRDYARFGLLFANGGAMDGKQIISRDWVETSTRPSAPVQEPLAAGKPEFSYGYQWWVPPEAQQGEFVAIGIFGQYIYVNTQNQVVIATNSADRQFRAEDDAVTLCNIEVFRQIAAAL